LCSSLWTQLGSKINPTMRHSGLTALSLPDFCPSYCSEKESSPPCPRASSCPSQRQRWRHY
jgi:hypothetical protein